MLTTGGDDTFRRITSSQICSPSSHGTFMSVRTTPNTSGASTKVGCGASTAITTLCSPRSRRKGQKSDREWPQGRRPRSGAVSKAGRCALSNIIITGLLNSFATSETGCPRAAVGSGWLRRRSGLLLPAVTRFHVQVHDRNRCQAFRVRYPRVSSGAGSTATNVSRRAWRYRSIRTRAKSAPNRISDAASRRRSTRSSVLMMANGSRAKCFGNLRISSFPLSPNCPVVALSDGPISP